MTAANAINISTGGLVKFDGTSAFSSVTVTQYSLLAGAASNGITSLGVSANGQLPIGAGAGANPVLANLTAGTGISIVNGSGSITISSSATAISWSDEATNFSAIADHGYFVTATAVATLPASPSQGDTINFAYDGATGTLTITANTGQTIRIGSVESAAAGTCANTARGDSLTLVYRTVDTSWICVGAPQGVWLVT